MDKGNAMLIKTAGNFPAEFRKPFSQTSEGDLEFFAVHSQNVTVDS